MADPDWVGYAALGVSGLAVTITWGMFARATRSLKRARTAHGTADRAHGTSRESVGATRRAVDTGGHSVVPETQVSTSPFGYGDGRPACDFTVTNTSRGAVDVVKPACVVRGQEATGMPTTAASHLVWGLISPVGSQVRPRLSVRRT